MEPVAKDTILPGHGPPIKQVPTVEQKSYLLGKTTSGKVAGHMWHQATVDTAIVDTLWEGSRSPTHYDLLLSTGQKEMFVQL